MAIPTICGASNLRVLFDGPTYNLTFPFVCLTSAVGFGQQRWYLSVWDGRVDIHGIVQEGYGRQPLGDGENGQDIPATASQE